MSSNEFIENGYIVVKNIIDPTEYYAHMRQLEKEGLGMVNDGQVEKARAFFEDKKLTGLLEELRPTMEKHTGLKLYKTYFYSRNYKEGAILKNHKDREACEISVTINLGYEQQPWPIGIIDYEERAHSITLEPGDGMIYKGMEMTHWRERNTYGPCSQIFLHYVDQNGPYAHYKDDKNVGLDYRFSFLNKNVRISMKPKLKGVKQ